MKGVSTMAALAKTTFKEQAYTSIMNDILEGYFPMDEFLTEKRLIERYEMSKAPIREALVELCNEHVLRSIPRLGYQIVPVTGKEIADAIELRLNLELTAAKKWITSFNDSMLHQISQLNQSWWQEVINSEEMTLKRRWEHNSLFHTTLCSFGGNLLAADVVRRMVELEFRAYAQMLSTPEQQREFFANETKPHIEIEKALINRDFYLAIELLRNDILTLRNTIHY